MNSYPFLYEQKFAFNFKPYMQTFFMQKMKLAYVKMGKGERLIYCSMFIGGSLTSYLIMSALKLSSLPF